MARARTAGRRTSTAIDDHGTPSRVAAWSSPPTASLSTAGWGQTPSRGGVRRAAGIAAALALVGGGGLRGGGGGGGGRRGCPRVGGGAPLRRSKRSRCNGAAPPPPPTAASGLPATVTDAPGPVSNESRRL